MARIRSIKPEFPQSETIGALSRDARLLFIQLWTIVDDEGRARAASRMLASLLYPYDNDAPKLIDRWLDELEVNQCLKRYEVEGSKYLEIVKWLKHQKIDHPTKSRLPEFAKPRENIAKPPEPLAPDLGPRTLDQDKDQEDIRAVARATRPSDDLFEEFFRGYPKRDGANPKAPARKKFLAACKAGADPREIIAAAERYSSEVREKGQFGTPYVAQAVTWLNQQRWGDYEAQPETNGGWRPGLPTEAELREKYAKIREDQTRLSGDQKPEDAGVFREGGQVHPERGDGLHDPPGDAGMGCLDAILRPTHWGKAIRGSGRDGESRDDERGSQGGNYSSDAVSRVV